MASNPRNLEFIDALVAQGMLPREDLTELLTTFSGEDRDYATSQAYKITRARFGDAVYAAGVIEVSNHCSRDCYYCGIRSSREGLDRYRMTSAEVVECCQRGHDAGIRTFLLTTGEDPDLCDDLAEDMIWRIRRRFPDSAIALAFGERPRSRCQRYFDAGADRYILRHETADPAHFALLHPRRETLTGRLRCLTDLRDIGFQTGCGMMIGSPFQLPEHLAEDLELLGRFAPEVVDVGPFLPHHATPLGQYPAGSIDLTLFVMSLIRIILPDVIMPVTTALGSLHRRGRELGIMAGANAVMPNLTPPELRRLFDLFDHQVTEGAESIEGLAVLGERLAAIGYRIVTDRGDFKDRG